MKKHLRLICLLIAVVMAMSCVSVSAVQVYEEGNTVIFHGMSPNYIVDDEWITGSYYTEFRDDVLFVALDDFKVAFRCNISYNYNDTSIYMKLENKSLWQGLGYDTIFVSGNPTYAPAPYISSAEGHPVMIPLKFYATSIGYDCKWETPESYKPGIMTFSMEKVPYTLIGLEVNQAAQLVSVIGKSPTGVVKPVKYMLCSTGVGDATPNGTYKVNPLGTDWYYFSLFNCYVRYCSQLTGNICFHSLTFNSNYVSSLSKAAYNDIGKKASHGCIRLFVEDAKFIHQNCRYLPVTISPGYTNAETDAIRAQIIAQKPTYEEYIKDMN